MAKTQNAIDFSATTNTQLAVGLTTAGPNALDVNGAVAIGNGFAGTATAPTNGLIVEGKMGIGVTAPSALLEISSTSTSSILNAVFVQNFNEDAVANKGSSLTFQTKDNGGVTRTQATFRCLTRTTNAQESSLTISGLTSTGFTTTLSNIAGYGVFFLTNGTAIFPSGFDGVTTTYNNRGFSDGALEIGYNQTNDIGIIASITESSSTFQPLFYHSLQTGFYLEGSGSAAVTTGASSKLALGFSSPPTSSNSLDLSDTLRGSFAFGNAVGGGTGDGAFIWGGTDSFIGVKTTTPQVGWHINGSQSWKITEVNVVNYTTVLQDSILFVNTGIGAVTVNLFGLVISGASSVMIVKDFTGNAATNPITVRVGGGTINGAASFTINTNYGHQKFYISSFNQWFTL